MKTAKPANREKVWTAGMEDSAPAGRRKRYDTSGLRVSGSAALYIYYFLLTHSTLIILGSKLFLKGCQCLVE